MGGKLPHGDDTWSDERDPKSNGSWLVAGETAVTQNAMLALRNVTLAESCSRGVAGLQLAFSCA